MTSIPNFNLYITDKDNAGNFHTKEITHFISIGDVDSKMPYIKHWGRMPKVYRFEFDDVGEYADRKRHSVVTQNDVSNMIAIGVAIRNTLNAGSKVNLLVHCAAGISRSTATAYVIVNIIMGAGHERECMQMVYDSRPIAMPNSFIVKIADNLLDRKGKMVEVVSRFNMSGAGVVHVKDQELENYLKEHNIEL
jgi:predicted protein tyrosine phosphatase